jgi:hypothetical protein
MIGMAVPPGVPSRAIAGWMLCADHAQRVESHYARRVELTVSEWTLAPGETLSGAPFAPLLDPIVPATASRRGIRNHRRPVRKVKSTGRKRHTRTGR